MKSNKRLSLEDFKVKKIESQNEIDKLIGGAAAACHSWPTKQQLPNGWWIEGTDFPASSTN